MALPDALRTGKRDNPHSATTYLYYLVRFIAMASVISASGLSRHYSDLKAVDQASSCVVEQGSLFGLLGLIGAASLSSRYAFASALLLIPAYLFIRSSYRR